MPSDAAWRNKTQNILKEATEKTERMDRVEALEFVAQIRVRYPDDRAKIIALDSTVSLIVWLAA
jgi:hypothetical protein